MRKRKEEASPPRCVQNGCTRPRAPKDAGGFYASCQPCRERRAANERRRRSNGKCSRCATYTRLPGDFLCERCRTQRDVAKAAEREDRALADAIDAWAAQPERQQREPTPEDCGISPWNARGPQASSASYWGALADPEPLDEIDWNWSPLDGPTHHRY